MGLGKLRNQLCPCHSGKKYKKCHYPQPFNLVRAAQQIVTSWTPLEQRVEPKMADTPDKV